MAWWIWLKCGIVGALSYGNFHSNIMSSFCSYSILRYRCEKAFLVPVNSHLSVVGLVCCTPAGTVFLHIIMYLEIVCLGHQGVAQSIK